MIEAGKTGTDVQNTRVFLLILLALFQNNTLTNTALETRANIQNRVNPKLPAGIDCRKKLQPQTTSSVGHSSIGIKPPKYQAPFVPLRSVIRKGVQGKNPTIMRSPTPKIFARKFRRDSLEMKRAERRRKENCQTKIKK